MTKATNETAQEQTETTGFSFPETEHEILKMWKEKNIFKKTLDKTRGGRPYIFYDGPPFATGLPHHGHLLAGTLKDIVPRYFTMKGFYVERRFGWDCHGLPIEHEIDKKLKMSAQDAVKQFGVKKYNDECRSIVQKYTSEWEKTVSRLGRWVDFENDYKTMDTPFMESVWWVFKQLWDKNLIYKGTKVMPLSTALGTVLSNFEAGQNYQDVQDPAITVLFKLDDPEEGHGEAHMAAWTTTPWTLPSNLGLCVNAEIEYSLVHDKDANVKFYLASARLETYSKKRNYEVLKTVLGSELKGRRYQPLFPYFKDLKNDGAFVVLTDNYVTTDNGTGVVHLAPSFGEDDNRVMKEAELHFLVCPIDDHGKFTSEVSDYSGQYVKEADKQIMKDLKADGRLYEQAVLVHSYPFCYRSNTPLLYKAIPSWYVKVESIVPDLIKSNEQISWVPGHIKEGRFGKWLENARDWAISRNRVWGTPLPIWENDTTGKFVCIGSIEELHKLTGVKVDDLHREYVDDLSFKISGEEGTYKRITEVLDCWFESGSMPYAQLHYPFENKEMFKDGFPAEFIAEGLDQTRGWFYTLTILSTALFNKPAFKNVIVNGLVLAEDGKKMSKSLRNFTAPDELMERFGADALRLYLINSGLVRGEEQRFSDAGVKDIVRQALLPWFNSYKFFSTYAEIDGFDVKKHFRVGNNIMDKWILSSLQTLKKNIAFEMERYQLYNVVPALLTFIEDLTNWYIRLNRSRFWGDGLTEDKLEAYSTLYTAVNEIGLAMAPFTPFLSDYIYQELKKFGGNNEESIHLCEYPIANLELIDANLEVAVSRMQQIILLGRQKRNQAKIKVKNPLRKISIIHKDQSMLNEIKRVEDYIKSELNIKEVIYTTEEDKFINLFAKPNSPVLGKRLGKNFGAFTQLISKLPASDLGIYEEKGSLTLNGETFGEGEILVFREAKAGTESLSNRFISIEIDITLDQDLIDEGLAREVVNRIQKTRKEQNFNVADRVSVEFTGSSELVSAILKHTDYIKGETLAETIKENVQITSALEFEIDEHQLKIKVTKY